MRCWAPVKLSPVDVWVDGRVLEEVVQLGCVVVGHFEEPSERLDPGALFLEKLDNRFSFSAVGGRGVQR